MKKYCYLNHKIIEEKNALISPYDLGLLRGYAVFDFMCTANGKPFLLTDHWNRLAKSARSLDLTLPLTKEEYANVLTRLLTKNPFRNAAIRTVVTGGMSPDGISLGQHPAFLIMIHDMDQITPAPHLYEKGSKIITHPFIRHNPESKTTNYIESIKMQKIRKRRNAIEVLYTDNKKIYECSTSNIFIIKGKTLFTPRHDILPGITRKLILKLAKRDGVRVKEQNITLTKLFSADEVFITGSAKHILPVTRIDTIRVGNGKVGDMTKKISGLYWSYFKSY